MKNLVAELDVLQAQLNKLKELDHESKLYKTKFIIEKAKLSNDAENLEQKVQNLKQDIANRKLHHCIKQVSRQVKLFKQVEPLKLKKRIKNATPEKKPALEAELDLVKQIVIDEWAEYIAKAQLSKYFGSMLGFKKRSMQASENNVYGRICKMASVKEPVLSAAQSIGEYYPVEGDVVLPPKTGYEASKDKNKSKDKEPKKEAKENNREEAESSEESVDSTQPKINRTEKQVDIEPGTPSKSAEHTGAFNDDFLALPEVSVDSDGDMEMESDTQTMEDDFFVAPNGAALPELATGYISGSDSEDEPMLDVIKPERKNRRGQRARRAIWEKKYGGGAKHVVKEREDQQKRFLGKQKKREFKVQKDLQREESAKARIERKKELEAKPLHPSWVAKQQQDKLKSVKPAGKKIVFD